LICVFTSLFFTLLILLISLLKYSVELLLELRDAFPDMKGWSVRNLERMRQLAQLYPGDEFPARAVSQLPWGHIITLIQKVKNEVAREWYAADRMILK